MLTSLPRVLIEIILQFGDSEDIRSVKSVNVEACRVVRDCLDNGRINGETIDKCMNCEGFMIKPKLVCYEGSETEIKDAYLLCSHNCRKTFLSSYPRCFYCLTVLKYTDELRSTLFCSGKCNFNSKILQRFQSR